MLLLTSTQSLGLMQELKTIIMPMQDYKLFYIYSELCNSLNTHFKISVIMVRGDCMILLFLKLWW